MFVRPIKKKNPTPGGTQVLLARKSLEHYVQRVLGGAVEGRRYERGGYFRTNAVTAPVVLRACPGGYNSLSAMLRESLEQTETCLQPANVLRRCPILSRLCIPGHVQEVSGSDFCHHQLHLFRL